MSPPLPPHRELWHTFVVPAGLAPSSVVGGASTSDSNAGCGFAVLERCARLNTAKAKYQSLRCSQQSFCSATENFQCGHSAQSASLRCSRCKPSRIGLLPGTTQAVLRGIQLLFCWDEAIGEFFRNQLSCIRTF